MHERAPEDPNPADGDDPKRRGWEDLRRRLGERGRVAQHLRDAGEIARGGMGAILKVWDDDLQRHLAMKVLQARASSGDESAASRVLGRFLEEAQITGQLDHPGIVPVHELGLDAQGRPWFTMKLVQGRDLRAVFELVFEGRDEWTTTRALGVLLKVCEAMAFAHEKGVIHRDLKPGNVMVGGFGEVYVMDWGLARAVGRADAHDIRLRSSGSSGESVHTLRRTARESAEDSPLVTMDGDIVGTPSYMAPEQARGAIDELSPRSDVYAIGAMLYHLLARRMPHVEPGEKIAGHAVLALVLHGPPKPLFEIDSTLAPELVAICEKAMARDPALRYPSTSELAADLRAYLEGRVVQAWRTGAWVEFAKWVKRNRALATTAAAALAVIVVGSLVTALVLASKNREVRAASQSAVEARDRLTNANAEMSRANAGLANANRELERRAAELADSKQSAERLRDVILGLADLKRLQDLRVEADAIAAAAPVAAARIDSWFERARELELRLPRHRQYRARLAPTLAAIARAGGSTSAGARPRELADTEIELVWLGQQLDTLINGLTSFVEPERGEIARMARLRAGATPR